jgi:hypothetical protein
MKTENTIKMVLAKLLLTVLSDIAKTAGIRGKKTLIKFVVDCYNGIVVS